MLGWFKKKKVKTEELPSPIEETVKKQEVEDDSPPRGTGIFGEPEEIRPEPVPEVETHHPAEITEDAETADAATDTSAAEEEASSLFRRMTEKLSRTRDSFVFQMDSLFLGKKEIDAELLDDLEELLITADIGFETSSELLDYARKKVKRKELSDPESLKKFIKEKLHSYIVDSTKPAELVMPESGPFVIMVIGVNGVGKTTTIGKIAHKFINSGQSVLLAAADTFRAAAVSQLKIWGTRNGIEVVAKGENADPSSVAFDAVHKAVEENYDVVMVDTAGRLHTQTNLMEELKKIKRVIGKKLEGAPHEILLVIDATTGQNGISQAKLFNEAVGVTGLALTKLDGTAKGGIVANISRYMNIPIRFIGIGENIEDLRDFDPDEFIEALFQGKS
ncbi:signal recognition particle-docking protein FtsY [Desulfopila inferna]|uniref:signal recognition particle-docking protein FtsY n=1 Tax=Desulfopila inferna TaxID=468528 RepID=UPI001965FC47|nr:signal recognition particle-docking protein FtsY [Desulfopila inferna]MBM9603212.1 signal recognition particle-docking protein FtsY [Desulfopila inferna]